MKQSLAKQQRAYEILRSVLVTWHSTKILHAGGRTITSILQFNKYARLIGYPGNRDGDGF